LGGWRAAAFAGGWAALFIALVSPLDRLASSLLSAHMAQHMLLVMAAAPLLAFSRPLGVLLLGLPRGLRQGLGRGWRGAHALRAAWHGVSHPGAAWALHAGALLLWHAPVLYQAALVSDGVHHLEHASLLGTGWLFWWVLALAARRAAPRSGWLRGPGAALYVFALALPTGLLGALMTFASVPWYPAYASTTPAWGLSPLGDQQLAGALMWVPGGIIYLAAALGLLGAWFAAAERRDHALAQAAGAGRQGGR
jgi:cytochrome c oxidase assembly factor CtaG